MIPCFFHPTQVIVIDDSQEFLNSLKRTLSPDQAFYRYITDPYKALQLINETPREPSVIERNSNLSDDKFSSNCELYIYVSGIYHEVYRPERFNQISTVIIDHSMPGMSGIEFCRQITDPYIEKILLTGVADEHLAVRAFNEGLINHYIRKQDIDMGEQLDQAIDKAKWRYFNKLSKPIIHMIKSIDTINQVFHEPVFESMVKMYIRQKKIKEFYLCEAVGSYLFLTKEAEVYGLMVQNDEQIETWEDIGSFSEIDPRLMKDIKERKKMMCYHTDISEDFKLKDYEWRERAHQPQIFQGLKNKFYYVFAPDLYDLDKDKILSFQNYLNKKKEMEI